MQGCLIDANVWIAVSFEQHDHHALANRFISETSPDRPALLCRATEQSWLRLLTTPALHRRYDSLLVSNRDALTILSDTLELPNVRLVEVEPSGVRALWHRLAAIPSASPKVWMDAYLAAFAICHDVEFVTLDQDFKNFERNGLKLQLLTT
ncbi:MAG: PIN domain-containing protein [Verrucomicrobia bacterium]|nr:PIN domain-containing protein [Verrucomicrobiota bacterium]